MLMDHPPYLVRKLFPDYVWKMPSGENEVFLTFDDGPHPEVTPYVMEVLDKFSAKATFFCVGENVRNNQEIFEQIIKSGHAVGNHTDSHLNGWRAADEIYLKDFRSCCDLVNSNLFRPPYGKIKNSQAEKILKTHKIIMWDVLSRDFDNAFSPASSLKLIKKHTCPGSILIFHDSKKAEKNLRQILPEALTFMVEKGYRLKAIPFEPLLQEKLL